MILEDIRETVAISSPRHYSSTVVAPCTRYGCCHLGIATRAPYLGSYAGYILSEINCSTMMHANIKLSKRGTRVFSSFCLHTISFNGGRCWCLAGLLIPIGFSCLVSGYFEAVLQLWEFRGLTRRYRERVKLVPIRSIALIRVTRIPLSRTSIQRRFY